MTQQNSQRVVYLDILRILATFGVIFIHITADGLHQNYMQFNWYVAVAGDSLVRWAVPIFVMISGALFLNPEKEFSYRDILMKKVPRLLTAYVAWWLIYTLAIIFVWHIIKNEPVQTDWIMPHYHLWFLPMLMGVYLLIPVLRKIAADEKLLRYLLILWICYLFGSFVFIKEFRQITPLFGMNVVVGFSGYFLLGYFLSKNVFMKRQKIWIYVLGIAGVLITMAGERFFNYLSPNVALMSIALFVLVKENSTNVGERCTRFIGHVRNDLFGIYLVHAMWLMVVNKDVFRDLCSHAVSLPVICIVTFVLSLYTTKVLRKIPLLKRIVE